jgi:hypothetical protein
MSYTNTFTPGVIPNPYTGNAPGSAIAATTAQFKQLSTDDKLALLWFAYAEIGKGITPAAPGAARLQLAEGLLEQIKAMPQADQLRVMRELAENVNTPICRSYGVLSINTKLAFWYQLAEYMQEGTVIPVPAGYRLSTDAARVLSNVIALDYGQQITFLRNSVVGMGIDPLA